MVRQVIYPKDIMIITGKSDKYSRTLIKKMKSHFQKEEHQVVSVDEFCQYMGLQKDSVQKHIY